VTVGDYVDIKSSVTVASKKIRHTPDLRFAEVALFVCEHSQYRE
jgi:hypothetical protein